MLSYWLDEEREFDTVPELLAALAELGVELWVDHQEDVWVIRDRGRPKFIYNEDPEPGAERVKSVWFIRTGDQFIFSTESESELRPFLTGMLAPYLMKAVRPAT